MNEIKTATPLVCGLVTCKRTPVSSTKKYCKKCQLTFCSWECWELANDEWGSHQLLCFKTDSPTSIRIYEIEVGQWQYPAGDVTGYHYNMVHLGKITQMQPKVYQGKCQWSAIIVPKAAVSTESPPSSTSPTPNMVHDPEVHELGHLKTSAWSIKKTVGVISDPAKMEVILDPSWVSSFYPAKDRGYLFKDSPSSLPDRWSHSSFAQLQDLEGNQVEEEEDDEDEEEDDKDFQNHEQNRPEPRTEIQP